MRVWDGALVAGLGLMRGLRDGMIPTLNKSGTQVMKRVLDATRSGDEQIHDSGFMCILRTSTVRAVERKYDLLQFQRVIRRVGADDAVREYNADDILQSERVLWRECVDLSDGEWCSDNVLQCEWVDGRSGADFAVRQYGQHDLLQCERFVWRAIADDDLRQSDHDLSLRREWCACRAVGDDHIR